MQDYTNYQNPLTFRKQPPVIPAEKERAAAAQAPRQKEAAPAPIDRGSRLSGRTFLVRAGMFLVLAFSVVLVWWSVTRRLLPASRELRDKAVEMSRLQNEVQALELAWNPEEVRLTEERFQQAQAQLFEGKPGLAEWQGQLFRAAEAHALGPVEEPLAGRSQPLTNYGGISRRPVTLDVRPLEIIRTTNSAYRRLLTFTRMLEEIGKRADLVDVSVRGNSNSVQQASLRFEAWTKDEVPQ